MNKIAGICRRFYIFFRGYFVAIINIIKPNVVGQIWRESIFEYSDSETPIILQI